MMALMDFTFKIWNLLCELTVFIKKFKKIFIGKI